MKSVPVSVKNGLSVLPSVKGQTATRPAKTKLMPPHSRAT